MQKYVTLYYLFVSAVSNYFIFTPYKRDLNKYYGVFKFRNILTYKNSDEINHQLTQACLFLLARCWREKFLLDAFGFQNNASWWFYSGLGWMIPLDAVLKFNSQSIQIKISWWKCAEFYEVAALLKYLRDHQCSSKVHKQIKGLRQDASLFLSSDALSVTLISLATASGIKRFRKSAW